MPVRQFCNTQPVGAAAAAPARLAAGQMSVCDLPTDTSIVAVDGDLQLVFLDHSLAWLGDAVALTSIILYEGERFVTPQRGVVTIHAPNAGGAAFVTQTSRAENVVSRVVRQAVLHLASLVKARLRRLA